MTLLSIVFCSGDKPSGYALLSAFFDGMQFLGTRTVAAAVEKHGSLSEPTDVAALALKITCVLLVLHFQQLALGGDLSRVGASLPVLQNLMCGSLGAAFFGDLLDISTGLVTAACMTGLGLWLLSRRPSSKIGDEDS